MKRGHPVQTIANAMIKMALQESNSPVFIKIPNEELTPLEVIEKVKDNSGGTIIVLSSHEINTPKSKLTHMEFNIMMKHLKRPTITYMEWFKCVHQMKCKGDPKHKNYHLHGEPK